MNSGSSIQETEEERGVSVFLREGVHRRVGRRVRGAEIADPIHPGGPLRLGTQRRGEGTKPARSAGSGGGPCWDGAADAGHEPNVDEQATLANDELLAQREVLQGELAVAAAEEREQPEQVEQEGDYRAGILSGSEVTDQPLGCGRSLMAKDKVPSN